MFCLSSEISIARGDRCDNALWLLGCRSKTSNNASWATPYILGKKIQTEPSNLGFQFPVSEGLPQHGDIPISVFPWRVCIPSQGEWVSFWDLNVRIHLVQFSSPKLTKPVIICVWPIWVFDRSSLDNFVLSGCPGTGFYNLSFSWGGLAL